MKVNPKKRLVVKNRTHYFNPTTTKVYNEFESPNAYSHRSSKVEGYENRLYWEYRYCDEHDGQTYFYTLTYNDKNIPKYFGKNCFDYNHLRELLNGAFKKNLLRNYGTLFNYFVGPELGDGKGSRGLDNNPHYHVLFFLRNAEDERYPYKKISPFEFRHLVREYWQGFDEDINPTPYQLAKKGIAKEGDNYGLVTDFRACMYCAKYVTKDAGLVKHEKVIEYAIRSKYLQEIRYSEYSYDEFWKKYIIPHFNIREGCTVDDDVIYKFNDDELFNNLFGDLADFKYERIPSNYSRYTILKFHLMDEYKQFLNDLVEEKVKDKIRVYRNRFCNKVRISHGVGDYALKFISDDLNPTIQVPSKYGFKERPLGMYYYRKLFTNVQKDAKGQNIYVLNQKGIDFKVNHLSQRIEKLQEKVMNYVSLATKDVYEDAYSSSINTECFTSYNDFKQLINNNNLKKITKKYAEFKLVYEGRFFEDNGSRLPKIDVVNDYRRFITPIVDKVDYRFSPVSSFLKKPHQGYMAYNAHPYFLSDSCLFPVFDLLSDYFFIQKDNVSQKEAEEISKVRKYHVGRKINSIYGTF